MLFTETRLKDVFIIDIVRLEDARGFFGRAWCQDEFEKHGLNPHLVQCNLSFNKKRGTLRGMHYQTAPYEEAKLVRCTMGLVYDVVIDLRPDSPTYMQWLAVELTAENRRALYVPEGFAHGFQTLVDNSEVFYQMSEFHFPDAARGVRWNDRTFDIQWPIDNPIVSEKDNNFPDWSDA